MLGNGGGGLASRALGDQGNGKEGAWPFIQSFLRQVVALFFGFSWES